MAIAFLLLFLLPLIEDPDNPFGLADNGSPEDVSLERLESVVLQLGPQPLQPSLGTLNNA